MRRRDFIIGASAVTASLPLVALAQPTRTHPLVAFLHPGPKERFAGNLTAFRDGMRDLGYFEGQTWDLAARFANMDGAQLDAEASELVSLRPNVIVADDPAALTAISAKTTSIPLVCPRMVQPVKFGLIASEARPGGNITGIENIISGLWGKNLELLRELVPSIKTLGVLANLANPSHMLDIDDIRPAAEAAGVRVIVTPAATTADVERSLQLLIGPDVQGILVLADEVSLTNANRIAEVTTAARLPVMSNVRALTDAGCLVSYGVSTLASDRRSAYFVDRILKGANPGDLPIEFPAKLELIVNLKTAKAIGVAIPQSLLIQADQVIE